MAERLFDHDPTTGMTTYFDSDGENWWFRYVQDVRAALDQNKAAQNEGFNKRAEMWHAAHIPDTVILKWYQDHGIDVYDPNHREGVKRLLNSNEYRYLRVKNFIM